MTVPAPAPDLIAAGNRGREFTLWGGAGALVLVAHVSAAWYLSELRPADAMPAEAPSAIMLELAPIVSAPEAVPEEVPELVETAMATPVEEVVDTVEPEPIDNAEPVEIESVEEIETPVEQEVETETVEEVQPETAEEIIPDVVEAAEPEVAVAALPEPKPVEEIKPKPKPIKKVEKKPVKKPEKKQQKKPAPQPQQPAKAQAQVAAKAIAAPSRDQGAGSSDSPARWQSRVNAHLNRHKRYPAGGGSGTVSVRFSINASGHVLAASVARSSGNAALDSAAVDMVRRASPVPAPPPAIARSRMSLTVPVRFSR